MADEIPWRQAGCRALAKQLGLRPSKRMGQNFLSDRGTLERIVAEAAIQPGEAVLEVGPGMGHLSSMLLDAGARLTAVELDERLAEHVRGVFGERMCVIEEDALAGKHALGAGIRAWLDALEAPAAVVANLPYSIASPLLVLLATSGAPLRTLVVLVQREVAERILAAPGTKEYGPLTVQLRYRAEAVAAFDVGPSRFWPRPKVASTVVRLTPRLLATPASDDEGFAHFVRAILGHRRKTLSAALRRARQTGLPETPTAETVGDALEAVGQPRDVRAERLSVETMVALYNRLGESS